MNTKHNKTSLPSFSRLPKSYAALCAILMPRVIHDAVEHEAVTEIIDLMAGHELSKDQEDYLMTLSELSESYETQNLLAVSRLPAHEFLASHLENIGMSISEWGRQIGIDRSTASRLLRGERKLNTEHIRKTADVLKIEASLLI